MFVCVGLGNPGQEYNETRHNVGFMILDEMAHEAGTSIDQLKFDGLYARGRWNNNDVVFIKPQTYMNLSGHCVRSVLSFFKIPVEQLIVVFDDLDQAPGNVKTRTGGGHGGHNGIRSLLEQLPSDQFHRVKIGIGKPEHKSATSNWVLGKFTHQELDFLNKDSFPKAKKRILDIMNQVKKKNSAV